jgi:hypothetical protein
MKIPLSPALLVWLALPSAAFAAAAPAAATAPNNARLAITATNPLGFARASQTLELSARDLAGLNEKDFTKVRILDAAGREVLAQAVDTDFDAFHLPDMVIFQADFAAGETKRFTATVGAKQTYLKEQFKAFGRFNRERFDDFVWENDRIAHRTYGKGLETWQGEPLTSSTVDIWSKRTTRMVANDWYLADDYHVDHGEGADFYSAGRSRGNGGSGLWAGDKLWVSRNFVASRVLANGPIRILFELDYEAFDVNGVAVTETKRISLDGGSNLDHYVSTYRPARPVPLTAGVGLKKVAGAQKDLNAARGILTLWEKVEKNQGMQGIALVVDPKSLDRPAEDDLNHLLLVKAAPDNTVSYWAGFFWDKSGQFPSYQAFQTYVDQFAQGLQSPITVKVAAE